MNDDSDKEEALKSGIIILSGGHDVSSNLILTIPTSKLENLSEWDTQDLMTLFVHFATISKYLKSSKESPLEASQTLPLACLADLRHASTLTIKQLIESLEAVEHQQRGTISAVYFLKPRNKTRSHILKKLLGIKPSKKRPRVPLFKVVLMKTLQELHTSIDVSQLTVDFCGTLQYNHVSWMHLYTVVIKCIESCQDLLTKLPSVRDKVDLLQEYETDGLSSGQVQQLLADLMEKFNIILSESNLPLCLTQCKQILLLLDNPSSDSHLTSLHPNLVKSLKLHLRDLYSELDQWNHDLEEVWRVTENRLTILIQVHRHGERAKEIERKIREHYHPLLREHPIVGKTLSQAELYRAHFTTTLYDPAKELLSQATEILEAVQKLKNNAASPPSASSSGHDSAIGSSNSGVNDLDISDINKCLTTSIQPFTSQLQHLQQLYVSIHIFHLLFEKALTWYKKVLKFLPESLLQRCTSDLEVSTHNLSPYNLSPQARECLVYMPTEWLGAVRVFLSRHPPPRQEHIDRLDESIPQLVDRKLKSQARSLALRLRLLQRVLTSTRLPLRLVTAVMQWRVELFGAPHQEKSASSHHPTSPTKDRHKIVTGATRGKSEAEQSESRDSVRKDGTRHLRNKKSASFDQEPQREKHSHVRLAKSVSGPSTSEEMKQPERPPSRKSGSAKTMPRSKSVEFNFNSSSTDGSVFDYDRALLQAESGPDMIKTKSAQKKGRSVMKEVKPLGNWGQDMKPVWREDQAFSDPSEMLQPGIRTHKGNVESADPFTKQNPMRRVYRTDSGNGESKANLMGHNTSFSRFPYSSEMLPEPEPPVRTSTLKRSHSKPSVPDLQQPSRERCKPSPLDASVISPSAEERFIRLTFTPKNPSTSAKPVFQFGSMDNLLTDSAPHGYEEMAASETDTAEEADPYDSIVKRIREISACNLTNVEKLKLVSELLSNSQLKRGSSKKSAEENLRPSKLSFSTLDLRPREMEHANEVYTKLGALRKASYSSNQGVDQEERPVDAVLRMKRNLARSMEELNMVPSNSEQLLSHPNQPVCWTNIHTSVQNPNAQQNVRYISELKIQPVYVKPSEGPKKITVIKSDTRECTLSDVEAYTRESSPKTEDGNKPRSWSDVESVSPEISGASATHNFISSIPEQKTQQGSQPNTFRPGSHKISATNNTSQNIPSRYPTELNEGRNQARPSSLSLFSSRNFISPSFLRPASSMRDLRTMGHPEMTFELPQVMDLDADYQVLEDLEMLQELQEDSLSNDFSKIVSSLYRNPPERKSGGNTLVGSRKEEPGNSDSLQSSENPSHLSALEQRAAQGLQSSAELDVLHVPEITVGYVLNRGPSLYNEEEGEGEEDDPSYLYAQSSNLDRLTCEADQEYLSQEEVADSLRETQRILEEEERRRIQRLHLERDEDEEEAYGGTGRLSYTTSLDHGYGSWTSKLKSTHSTSSEGASMEPDKDWRKLSISSADSVAAKSRWDMRSSRMEKDSVDEGDAAVTEVDSVPDLPQFEKPLTDPDLY